MPRTRNKVSLTAFHRWSRGGEEDRHWAERDQERAGDHWVPLETGNLETRRQFKLWHREAFLWRYHRWNRLSQRYFLIKKSHSIKDCYHYQESEERSQVAWLWVLISLMTFSRPPLASSYHRMNSRILDCGATFCRRLHFPGVNGDFRYSPPQTRWRRPPRGPRLTSHRQMSLCLSWSSCDPGSWASPCAAGAPSPWPPAAPPGSGSFSEEINLLMLLQK